MEPSEIDVDPALVAEVATRYGIDLDHETAAEHTFGVKSAAALLTDLPETGPRDDPPSVIEAGDDDHGAVRYRFRLGGQDGPLSDLDVAVKDNTAVAGVPMTCGSAAVEYEPPVHATVVDRLRAAGATVVATTNMDEFAYHTTGETCAHGRIDNPSIEGRIPGGSSAGSAAVVAAGIAEAALGTDTGGSVRIPASFCGVVGLKPTYGSVSRFGVADLAPTLDHVGVLAGSVETAARTFEAVSGPDPRDPGSLSSPAREPGSIASAVPGGVEGSRIGVVREAMAATAGPVAKRVETATDALAADGAAVEELSVEGYGDAPVALAMLTGAEFAAVMDAEGRRPVDGAASLPGWTDAVDVGEDYGEFVREQLATHGALAAATDGENYRRATAFRRAFAERMGSRFDDYDTLVTPTTPITAPSFGAVEGGGDLLQTMANTAPFNLTGHPAVSVPCGVVDGAPVGLQVVADYGAEATAVRIAGAIERSTGS